MSGVNNIFSSSYDNSYLFSSLSSSTSTSSSSSSGNILGIDFGEYSSITKGSYSKLIKAYYQKYGTKSSSSSSSSTDDAQSKITKTNIKDNANTLYKAAETLAETGRDSLFQKVDIKDEETGTTTKGYDTDKIYKAVSSFVDAYNSAVKSSANSDDNAVLRQSVNMINSTSANSSLLSQVGIKIGENNTLSVDEDTFKNSDMSVVKSLFQGSSSYGGGVARTASNMYLRVNNSLGNSTTYTSDGTYSSYTTGSLMNSLL
jgi:hypothetical protein